MTPGDTGPRSDPPEGTTPSGTGAESCPVCGGPLLQEKCKVVCRSPACVCRIIYTCAEF